MERAMVWQNGLYGSKSRGYGKDVLGDSRGRETAWFRHVCEVCDEKDTLIQSFHFLRTPLPSTLQTLGFTTALPRRIVARRSFETPSTRRVHSGRTLGATTQTFVVEAHLDPTEINSDIPNAKPFVVQLDLSLVPQIKAQQLLPDTSAGSTVPFNAHDRFSNQLQWSRGFTTASCTGNCVFISQTRMVECALRKRKGMTF